MATKVALSTRLQAAITRDLPTWLTSNVDAYLEGAGHEKPHTDKGWWHPSSLSTLCEAQLAFDYLGIPRDRVIPAKLRRIFDNGHGRDISWKQYLRDSGISLLKGDYLTGACSGCGTSLGTYNGQPYRPARHICLPSVRVRGELDDYIQTPEGPRVFEFKTKNDALWKALRAPDPDHLIQVQPYMVAKGAEAAIIVYENKNDQQLKSFLVPYNAELWEEILARLQAVREKLEAGYEILRGCKGACDYSGCLLFNFGEAYNAAFPRTTGELQVQAHELIPGVAQIAPAPLSAGRV